MSNKNKELLKRALNEIREVSNNLGIHPQILSRADFLSNSDLSDWDLRKLGGLAALKKRFPMTEKVQNLQDKFLNKVRKDKMSVTVFLVNGVKLQGVVTWFDNFCVLLRRDGHSQLVYKHAISTIMPGHPIQLFEAADEPGLAGEKT